MLKMAENEQKCPIFGYLDLVKGLKLGQRRPKMAKNQAFCPFLRINGKHSIRADDSDLKCSYSKTWVFKYFSPGFAPNGCTVQPFKSMI